MNGHNLIFTKSVFRKVFESNPDEINELERRFPGTFDGGNEPGPFGNKNRSDCEKCSNPDNKCTMRIKCIVKDKISYTCAYNSFFFYNITLDDVKLILKLFMIENKIK